jgi:hypothetical protein
LLLSLLYLYKLCVLLLQREFFNLVPGFNATALQKLNLIILTEFNNLIDSILFLILILSVKNWSNNWSNNWSKNWSNNCSSNYSINWSKNCSKFWLLIPSSNLWVSHKNGFDWFDLFYDVIRWTCKRKRFDHKKNTLFCFSAKKILIKQ